MNKPIDCVASVVVYNNSPEMVRETAESFLRTEDLKVRIYVLDNSPTPVLSSAFTGLPVDYHFNGDNIGFGKAHNLVLMQAQESKYHLILNPDIFFQHGVLEKLVEYMDSQPDVGVVCPKVLYDDGSLQCLNKRLPSVYDLFLRRLIPLKLRRLFQQRLDYYEMKDVGYDKICDVPFVTGAFMFCRTSVIKEVGGFDSRYFMYFEDADLSRKVQEHGFRTVYYPEVSVVHHWHRAPYSSIRMAIVMTVNGIRYFNKWGWKFI